MTIHFVEKDAASETGAFAAQSGGATVNVIVASAAGGELELSQAKGVASE